MRRGFFALNDDNFWGNGIEENDDEGGAVSQSRESVKKRESEDEKEWHPNASDGHASNDKADEWIDVRERSGPRLPTPARRNNFDSTKTIEAHANLLNKKDFTALEVLNAVCRDGNSPAQPNPFTPMPQQADASGFGAGLGRFKRPIGGGTGGEGGMGGFGGGFGGGLGGFGGGLRGGSGARDEDEMRDDRSSVSTLSVYSEDQSETECRPFPNGNNNGFLPQRSERAAINLMDEKYVEYYEYLCKGINKLLESGLPINIDCESRSPDASFPTTSVCSALKSKFYHQYSPGPEVYSRKVFVGGLPIDIDEDELVTTFSSFGPLVVDWPNKNETKSYFPPKGYVFLIFEYEMSVRALVQKCFVEDEKLFLYISSPLSPEKLAQVQIRPWRLADADYVVDVNVPINPRRVVFVGGVPRPIRAVELAHIMDRLYGSVSCAGIDTDVEYKYPKGAGRVAFTNYNSYMRAITDRYAQMSHGEVEKRVEMKPYVLDDQTCEECGGRHAPFFCPHMECLQYYCESCWTAMHGCPSREDHKPLVKEA